MYLQCSRILATALGNVVKEKECAIPRPLAFCVILSLSFPNQMLAIEAQCIVTAQVVYNLYPFTQISLFPIIRIKIVKQPL